MTLQELAQLGILEGGIQHADVEQPLLTSLLSQETVAVPLLASTRDSVFREMVLLSERSWQVYDHDAVLLAIRQREEICTTAMTCGVAILHPRRPLPDTVQGDSFIAFGKTAHGIPFGGGGLTDLFFLVSCRDQKSHLRALARLSRLLFWDGFCEKLRACKDAVEAWNVIDSTERILLGNSSDSTSCPDPHPFSRYATPEFTQALVDHMHLAKRRALHSENGG